MLLSVDADAEFDRFCRREYPRLVGALSFYCGDSQLGEELAQEALARTYDRWAHVRTLRAPAAWVHRVAINLAHSRFRRRSSEARAIARLPVVEAHEDGDVASAVAVHAAVAVLPRHQRVAVTLRYLLDLPVRDTAEIMGISEAAVRQHTHRAVVALRRRFLPRHAAR